MHLLSHVRRTQVARHSSDGPRASDETTEKGLVPSLLARSCFAPPWHAHAPSFWPEGKSARPDILDGNTTRQIEAIWASLSRGSEGGLPPGLVQGRMELVATNEPVIYRNFIEGAGARAIGVGYPEKANLAFDADQLRLAMIWQGPFIDAAMHRIGRGEGLESRSDITSSTSPPGPTLAMLLNADAPWPLEMERSRLPNALVTRSTRKCARPFCILSTTSKWKNIWRPCPVMSMRISGERSG